MKINDVILQTVTKIVTFIILTFAIYLFFAGHHNPGGGFIGGLVISSALILMLLAFDIETVTQTLPINYKVITGLGVLVSLFTGMASFVFHVPFLSQAHLHFYMPIVNEEINIATTIIFEIGVAMAVVGTTMTVIVSISRNKGDEE
ncbi:multisubunit sodium/proton antiporter MrpB subunit [Sinobaca qinghaiensis]|uniref:Multisubunit sodium/proton antiporter MrpB subunit n=1 Tax=Sinobaca qinghaiensis TaxID=342944 RepID=A0A419V4P5_9BACL|nr:Na(+)/H(+) antiporter subunit B [Sinobaca qinghaiensis]RKD73455.1 multisubunit sodium/proton antiporter MrpB subunit [Sinobaca qinghaiensis]